MSANSTLRAANGPNKARSLLQGQRVNIIIHASKNQIPQLKTRSLFNSNKQPKRYSLLPSFTSFGRCG